jgi:hypothetical protein
VLSFCLNQTIVNLAFADPKRILLTVITLGEKGQSDDTQKRKKTRRRKEGPIPPVSIDGSAVYAMHDRGAVRFSDKSWKNLFTKTRHRFPATLGIQGSYSYRGVE